METKSRKPARPVTPQERQGILADRKSGMSLKDLCNRYVRSTSTIMRIINKQASKPSKKPLSNETINKIIDKMPSTLEGHIKCFAEAVMQIDHHIEHVGICI